MQSRASGLVPCTCRASVILLSNLTLSNPQQQREAAEGETEEEALLLERAVSAARATLRRETAEAAAREAARCEEAERVQRLKHLLC